MDADLALCYKTVVSVLPISPLSAPGAGLPACAGGWTDVAPIEITVEVVVLGEVVDIDVAAVVIAAAVVAGEVCCCTGPLVGTNWPV